MKIIKLNREEHRAWRDNAAGQRDTMRKELLERSGGEPFRLMSSNGRFLGTVRSEKNTHVGTAASVKNAMYAPENCLCKQYAGTPEGQHHAICQFKAKWEAARAYAGAVPPVPGMMPGMGVQHMRTAQPQPPTNGVVHMSVPKQVSLHQPHIPTPTTAVATTVITTLPPDQCPCREFTKDPKHDPKQHHVICEHFDRWKMQHPTVNVNATPEVDERDTDTKIPVATAHDTEVPPADLDYVLVDLNTQKVLRDATGEEVKTALDTEALSGTPFVTVDETLFAVVPRASVPSHENNRTAD